MGLLNEMIKGYCNGWRSIRVGRNLCCPCGAWELPQKRLINHAWKEEMPICLWVWGIQHLRDWALLCASLNFQPVTDFCLEVKFCPWLGLEAALPSVCKVLRVRGRMEEKSLHIPLIKYLLYSCQEFCLKAKSDGLKEKKKQTFCFFFSSSGCLWIVFLGA